MHSAAAALAWELRRRHRWGLAAVLFYLAVLVAIRVFWIQPGETLEFEQRWSFALAVVVPLASTFTYFIAIFSFGLAGDLGGRRSTYPPRFFAYPLTDAELVKWPMLYGSLAMVFLWLATRLLALWPSSFTVPIVWPALFAAVILAWTQALTWMPYPIRGLRVVLMVLWLAFIGFGTLLALHVGVAEGTMLAILTPQAVLAYLVARLAVSRARHGDGAARRIALTHSETTGGRPARSRAFSRLGRPWSSPISAQIWLEWRRHGRSLPVLVGILMPFELSLLFAFREAPNLVWTGVAAALLTPPILAIFAAATVQRSSQQGGDIYQLTPFIATRPLSSAWLIGAKLAASLVSTLAAWLVVLVTVPLALVLSDTWPIVVDGFRQTVDVAGSARAPALWLLTLAALVGTTWKVLVQSLFIGLSGRPWLVKGSVFGSLFVLAILAPCTPWALANGAVFFSELWNALPRLLLILVVAKMSFAIWGTTRLAESRLLAGRWLVLGALCWDATVLCLYYILLWLVPTILVREYLLMMVAILAIPLGRLAAAPLALAWNRHR